MHDYKPNSHMSKEAEKEEKKKMERVVSGKATRKKNNVRKVTDMFISDDAQNIKSYVIMDVLVPAIKKTISEVVTDGIDMLLYGETGRGRKSSKASTQSYRKYYDDKEDRRDYSRTRTRVGYNFDDVIVNTRSEAEEVLSALDEALDIYDVVSVADLYDLAGLSTVHTDHKYGWTNIRSAEPIRVREGYLIKMPRPIPIK